MAPGRVDLDAFLAPLDIDDEKLADLAVRFSLVFKHLALNSLDQFLATPVNVLPNGSERGKFLSIDLGGTNLRVGLVELHGVRGEPHDIVRILHERSWSIEERIKYDKAEDLFHWIGDCIAEVVIEVRAQLNPQPSAYNPQQRVVPIGITFSFPMIQSSIRDATLMPMGKGFAITSNSRLGKLLMAGYSRHTTGELGYVLPLIEITAITNDSIATLASLAYTTQVQSTNRVVMGLIVGTGVNATVPLKLMDLHWSKRAPLKLPTSVDSDHSTTIVNTELTIKGAAGPLRELNIITRWDQELDRSVETPGFQPFEYMTGGRYIGELVRMIFLDLLVNGMCIDPAILPSELKARNGMSAYFLSKFVATVPSIPTLVTLLQQHLPPPDPVAWSWTSVTAQALQITAERVTKRSSALIAAASIGLLVCSGELTLKSAAPTGAQPRYTNGFNRHFWSDATTGDLVIAYTGGTISYYPDYLASCQAYIDRLTTRLTTAPERNQGVILREAKDGGIIGAGVLAGTVWNLPRRGSDTFSVPHPPRMSVVAEMGPHRR